VKRGESKERGGATGSEGHEDAEVRCGAVRALGLLRAQEGAGVLLGILGRGVATGNVEENGLNAVVGDSLARIGAPAAESLLVEARRIAESNDKASWDRRLQLLRAIRAGDGRGIVDAFDGGRVLVTAMGFFGPCDRFWVDLLAEVVPLDELNSMAAERRSARGREAEIVRAALAKKTAR
jgi:hypothetical protein